MSEKIFNDKLWEIKVHEIRKSDFARPLSAIINFVNVDDGKKMLRNIISAGAKWIMWLENKSILSVNCDLSAGFYNGDIFYTGVLYRGFVPLSSVSRILPAGYQIPSDAIAFVEPGKRWLDRLIVKKSVMVYGGDGFYDSSQPFVERDQNPDQPCRWKLLKNEKITVDRAQFQSIDIIFSRWGKIYFQRENDKKVIFELKDTEVDLILARQKTNVPWANLGFENDYFGRVVIMVLGGAFVRLSSEAAPFYYSVTELTDLHIADDNIFHPHGGGEVCKDNMGASGVIECKVKHNKFECADIEEHCHLKKDKNSTSTS